MSHFLDPTEVLTFDKANDIIRMPGSVRYLGIVSITSLKL
jgi:hypothetical protein